jgi:hypothetical protein
LGSVEPRFWTAELQQAVEQVTQLCRKLVKPGMEELAIQDGVRFPKAVSLVRFAVYTV